MAHKNGTQNEPLTTAHPQSHGLADMLRVAKHLVLSGWTVRDAAAWIGVSSASVRDTLAATTACRSVPAALEAEPSQPTTPGLSHFIVSTSQEGA